MAPRPLTGMDSMRSPAEAAQDEALLALLDLLARRDYRFVTPTPATHARVVARDGRGEARTLADVLGWSLPFRPGLLDDTLLRLLRQADVLRAAGGGLLRCSVRVSGLHEQLFVHSAYPTDARDAVFFGPDSYRFADLIAAELAARPSKEPGPIVDIGAGAGVGAIVAGRLCSGCAVTMVDVNPTALRFARINAQAAGVAATLICGDTLDGVEAPIGLAVANPPYIVDDAGRAYRHGGGLHGAEIALEMAGSAVERLAPRGRLMLYTGSAIIDGADPLCEALAALAARTGRSMRYREIDPDVFGEELERPAYADVDRIALIAAIIEA